jgi:hypothetical protein
MHLGCLLDRVRMLPEGGRSGKAILQVPSIRGCHRGAKEMGSMAQRRKGFVPKMVMVYPFLGLISII